MKHEQLKRFKKLLKELTCHNCSECVACGGGGNYVATEMLADIRVLIGALDIGINGACPKKCSDYQEDFVCGSGCGFMDQTLATIAPKYRENENENSKTN